MLSYQLSVALLHCFASSLLSLSLKCVYYHGFYPLSHPSGILVGGGGGRKKSEVADFSLDDIVQVMSLFFSVKSEIFFSGSVAFNIKDNIFTLKIFYFLVISRPSVGLKLTTPRSRVSCFTD